MVACDSFRQNVSMHSKDSGVEDMDFDNEDVYAEDLLLNGASTLKRCEAPKMQLLDAKSLADRRSASPPS